MPDDKNRLFLYEALELRAELDARIKTFRDCLPETRSNRNRFDVFGGQEGRLVPAEDFDLKKVNEQIRALETKRRKLNNAIQKTNFQEQIEHAGEKPNLAEALEMRKGLNERIGELHTLVVDSAHRKVIYKEDRDIVEPFEVSFKESLEDLDEARKTFRDLNRKIRAASFTLTVDFLDET